MTRVEEYQRKIAELAKQQLLDKVKMKFVAAKKGDVLSTRKELTPRNNWILTVPVVLRARTQTMNRSFVPNIPIKEGHRRSPLLS